MAMLTSRLTVPYQFNRPLRSRGEELRRRTFDLLIAVVALVLALPLLIVIAVAIRIDLPGTHPVPSGPRRDQWPSVSDVQVPNDDSH